MPSIRSPQLPSDSGPFCQRLAPPRCKLCCFIRSNSAAKQPGIYSATSKQVTHGSKSAVRDGRCPLTLELLLPRVAQDGFTQEKAEAF